LEADSRRFAALKSALAALEDGKPSLVSLVELCSAKKQIINYYEQMKLKFLNEAESTFSSRSRSIAFSFNMRSFSFSSSCNFPELQR
jgi:hypothetical protein